MRSVFGPAIGRQESGRVLYGLMALGISLALAALASHPLYLLVLGGCLAYLLFAAASLREPLSFVAVFLVVVVVLPPFFPSSLGETPLYVSSLLLPIGLAVALARLPDFQFRLDTVGKGLGIFLVGSGLSLAFAWELSGEAIAQQSCLRWFMLAQTALIYFLIRGGGRREGGRVERWLVPLLLVAGVLSAGYGIADFFWPVPLPHPAADQHIWLRTAILRRAQGVFYEAGNFANFCAFFLAITSSAFLARRGRSIGIPRPVLPLLISIFSLAVFVSFTRSTWVSVLATLLVFVAISKEVKPARALIFFLVLGIPLAVLWIYSPDLWNYLVSTRVGSFSELLVDPNLATSGRFETWAQVLSIVQAHPQYLLLGVGYKTLPFTRLFHHEIITDNGYLNLLLENGILGLTGFCVFSAAVFRTFLQLARKGRGDSAFWGALLFSFWCGECVQMMAIDAYTYWRNMLVFVALMALTLNRAERMASNPSASPSRPDARNHERGYWG